MDRDFLGTQNSDQDMVDWFKKIEKQALKDIEKDKKAQKNGQKKGKKK